MPFGLGLSEFLILAGLIAALSFTGLWPHIIRGIRELRGEHVPDAPSTSQGQDLDLCYKLLGLSPSASWDEIERAYKKKAHRHHPDHGGDDDTMRALNDAYRALKAIKRR